MSSSAKETARIQPAMAITTVENAIILPHPIRRMSVMTFHLGGGGAGCDCDLRLGGICESSFLAECEGLLRRVTHGWRAEYRGGAQPRRNP
eukprot:634529-Rhodomonas_salina.1